MSMPCWGVVQLVTLVQWGFAGAATEEPFPGRPPLAKASRQVSANRVQLRRCWATRQGFTMPAPLRFNTKKEGCIPRTCLPFCFIKQAYYSSALGCGTPFLRGGPP